MTKIDSIARLGETEWYGFREFTLMFTVQEQSWCSNTVVETTHDQIEMQSLNGHDCFTINWPEFSKLETVPLEVGKIHMNLERVRHICLILKIP